jgi:hypothetical protein
MPNDVAATTSMLSGFHFHPSEWMEYAKSAESTQLHSPGVLARCSTALIARGDRATDRLELTVWPAGASAPVPSTRGWCKILRGQLEETEYAAGGGAGEKQVVRLSELQQDSVTFYNGTANGTSTVTNRGPGDAYAIHLFASCTPVTETSTPRAEASRC